MRQRELDSQPEKRMRFGGMAQEPDRAEENGEMHGVILPDADGRQHRRRHPPVPFREGRPRGQIARGFQRHIEADPRRALSLSPDVEDLERAAAQPERERADEAALMTDDRRAIVPEPPGPYRARDVAQRPDSHRQHDAELPRLDRPVPSQCSGKPEGQRLAGQRGGQDGEHQQQGRDDSTHGMVLSRVTAGTPGLSPTMSPPPRSVWIPPGPWKMSP